MISLDISLDQIRILHAKCLDLLRLEIDEFKVKPTEVRHLIGRLGKFHCALTVGGRLAPEVNQHGFDVEAPDGPHVTEMV